MSGNRISDWKSQQLKWLWKMSRTSLSDCFWVDLLISADPLGSHSTVYASFFRRRISFLAGGVFFTCQKNGSFYILVYTYLFYSLISYGKAIPRQVVYIQVSPTSLHFSLDILARLNLRSDQVSRISRCLAAISELLLCIWKSWVTRHTYGHTL